MANILKTAPFVTKVLKDFMNRSGLEPTLLGAKNLRIVDARPGQVKFELAIAKQHCNRLNILHGGTIASMVDLGGSLAVASMGYWSTGVSTDLNVTYLSSGGKAGDTLKGLAELDKIGKTLAFTRISFFDEKDALVARGSHTKFVKPAINSQVSPYRTPMEPEEENSKSTGPF